MQECYGTASKKNEGDLFCMTKTHRRETVEEYDADGKLVRKTTTEETEESDQPSYYQAPNWWNPPTAYGSTNSTT